MLHVLYSELGHAVGLVELHAALIRFLLQSLKAFVFRNT